MTWALVWSLLKNRYVQYGLAFVALLGILLAVRHHDIEVGKAQGVEQGKHESQALIQKAHDDERAVAVTTIAQKDAEAKAAGERADAAEATAAEFAKLNRTLIEQRGAVAGKVNAVPDSGLHQATVDQLGIRAKNDPTPGYYPAEERALLTCAIDRPLCQKQNDALAKQVDSHTEAINELRAQVAANEAKYSALATWTGQLEGHYAAAVNLFPPKVRGLRCVYLYACKKKLVPVPKLEDLERSKPK